MSEIFLFIFNSIILGVGLAMDAFSVSLANGLNEPYMSRKRMSLIAGMYAFFQGLMPLIGWLCVHKILDYFDIFEEFVPWIALILLSYIGGKMIYDSIKKEGPTETAEKLSMGTLLIQAIATSIDALSVGFTIAEYDFHLAFIAALIIAGITFAICIGGLHLGKKFGTIYAGKASIFGGILLIGIGIEIFISGIFF
jgi:putative Mn2+ efflux pump MntP